MNTKVEIKDELAKVAHGDEAGDYFLHEDGELYVMAVLGGSPKDFVLIDVEDGFRWSDPGTIIGCFSGDRNKFKKVNKVEITIK